MTFIEIDHEIIYMVILPLLLIQERQLSITGKSMFTKYWLTFLRTKLVQENCNLIKWTIWHDSDLNSIDWAIKL